MKHFEERHFFKIVMFAFVSRTKGGPEIGFHSVFGLMGADRNNCGETKGQATSAASTSQRNQSRNTIFPVFAPSPVKSSRRLLEGLAGALAAEGEEGFKADLKAPSTSWPQ